MLKFFSTFLLGTIMYAGCFAQFAPPGLGKANTASWFAIGVKQNLNQKETISSATHFGIGHISNPDDNNFLKKPSIYVVNQEFNHRFKKHWEYALALSYRLQNQYKTTGPYDLDHPKFRQEVRFYSRFSYLNIVKNIEYSFSYRPEIRFFYMPDFSPSTESTQFRSRFRGKLSINLNSSKTQRISTTAELLFSTSKTTTWDRFRYDETRFCLYYSVLFPKQKLTLNLGYMNNLIGKSSVTDVHYLAVDVVLKNPFGK